MNIKKPVYLPKSIACVIEKIDDTLIQRVVYQNDRVTPGDLRLTSADASRLCGGKLSTESLIKGIAYTLCVYAYKGGIMPMQGIPAAIAAGIKHGQDLLARGQGIEGANLRWAIISAVTYMRDLPAKQIASKTIDAAADAATIDAAAIDAATIDAAADAATIDAAAIDAAADAQMLVWARRFWSEFWATPAQAKTKTKTSPAKTKTSKAA